MMTWIKDMTIEYLFLPRVIYIQLTRRPCNNWMSTRRLCPKKKKKIVTDGRCNPLIVIPKSQLKSGFLLIYIYVLWWIGSMSRVINTGFQLFCIYITNIILLRVITNIISVGYLQTECDIKVGEVWGRRGWGLGVF